MNLLPTIYWGRSFRHFVLASRGAIDRNLIVCNTVVPPKPVIDIAEVRTRSALNLEQRVKTILNVDEKGTSV